MPVLMEDTVEVSSPYPKGAEKGELHHLLNMSIISVDAVGYWRSPPRIYFG